MDRDGTICEEVNYLSRPEDLRLFPFSAEAISLLRSRGFLIILITNQSGIGRGFFDEKTLFEIHAKLQNELGLANSAIDAIYFCPHITSDGCECRKPGIGMIMQAERDFQVDLEKSWMVGDKISDIETGIRAKTKTALVLTGYGKKEFSNVRKTPDLTGEDLLAVARSIIAMPG